MKYHVAIVKFNNGNGALLCNKCSHIVAYGFEHEDRVHLCAKCEKSLDGQVRSSDSPNRQG